MTEQFLPLKLKMRARRRPRGKMQCSESVAHIGQFGFTSRDFPDYTRLHAHDLGLAEAEDES